MASCQSQEFISWATPQAFPGHSFLSYMVLLFHSSSSSHHSLNQSTSSLANLLSNYPHTHQCTTCTNHIIPYSFNMVEPLEDSFINPSMDPLHHYTELTLSLICLYSTLFILLIASRPLRLSICSALISKSLSSCRTREQTRTMPPSFLPT